MALTRISMAKFSNGKIQHANEIKGGVVPVPTQVPNGGCACYTGGGREVVNGVEVRSWGEDAEIYNAQGQLIDTDYDGQCP